MPKVKNASSSTSSKNVRKPISEENAEAQCIALAMNLTRERLKNGTASSQEITHFLKLGSQESRVKTEILELEKELIIAKTEKIKSEERVEKLYADAIQAMRNYSGQGDPDEY